MNNIFWPNTKNKHIQWEFVECSIVNRKAYAPHRLFTKVNKASKDVKLKMREKKQNISFWPEL